MHVKLNGHRLTYFYIVIDQVNTVQEILIVHISIMIFGSALFSKNGHPSDYNSRTLHPKSGGESLVIVYFTNTACGRRLKLEFSQLLLFIFTSLVISNIEDLCVEFSVITLNLIFKNINPNHLGFGKTFS